MSARRLLVVLALAMGMFAGTGILSAPSASAHPLGNFTVNRFSGIEVAPGLIRVRYVLDMAEIPTFQEMAVIDRDGDGEASEPEKQAWADGSVPKLLSRLNLEVNGEPVPLRAEARSIRFSRGQGNLPVLRMEATFVAPLAKSGSAVYRDSNYPGRLGWKEVTVSSVSGVAVVSSSVPATSVSNALSSYPVDMLSSPLDIREAEFSFRPGRPSAEAGTATGGGSGETRPASGGRFASLITRSGMAFPFLVLTLLLAFALGALHALGPGHGKTILAAYLVGAHGRFREAVAVGAAISLMHTASVLGLGVVTLYATRLFPPERVYPWLGVASGLVALVLGVRLLLARAGRQRRGGALAHPHHHHSHDHASDRLGTHEDQLHGSANAADIPSRPHPEKPLSRRGLLALAVSGGILPSPTALVVLVAAVALGRVGYGLALIAAFSIGLAAALTAVGVLALRAGSVVTRRLGGRAAAVLPTGSAAVLAVVGLLLTARGVLQVV